MPQNALRMALTDDSEAAPDRNVVKTPPPPCPDAFGAAIAFGAECFQVDVVAKDNACDIALIAWDGTQGDPIEIPRNSFFSQKFKASGFKIRNHTPGDVCVYQVTGWYKA